MSKDIIVKPRSNISDKLQYYFNESTRRIGILESKSTSQFDEEICELARESLNYISPGQKDALENKIRELDFRKTVARKIEDYADKWTNANITIIENMEGSVMGDIFKDVNQSVIANRGSIAEGKILLKNQGKTDIADAIAEIGKIINSASENILSIDKKKECTDLLNGITDQAKEPEPNKNILRSLGSSLFSILETVAPIAQSAKKAIDILKSWWL
ncbi:MAG: hypothetical protein MUF15_26605 [Acidobacteria bacterium]|nr:hypothetical protein [Acidobacteriota bacterium]